MKQKDFARNLKDLNYTVENIENSAFEIGDTVQILRTPEMIFPETLLTGLTGTVVGFDVLVNRWVGEDALILVLLPINNLGVYFQSELRLVEGSSRPLYVGLSDRIWGLIIQSLRKWTNRLMNEQTHRSMFYPGVAEPLVDRLMGLSGEIEWQLRERNIHDGKPVANEEDLA